MTGETTTPEPNSDRSPWWTLPAEEPPSSETLAWAAKPLGSGFRVTAVRRLTGGLVSSVHLLRLEEASGRHHEIVLRRFVGQHQEERAATLVLQESEVLRVLATAGLPAPALIASDPGGKLTGGTPALLMTRMPGEIHLGPEDGQLWLGQMARTLAQIHSTQLTPMLPRRGSAQVRGKHSSPWMTRHDLWARASEVTMQPPPPVTQRLIHGDYQHFNLLWLDGALSGVVDWGSAATGCPETDVGHCRLNLAVLFSVDWAERFRLAYESEAGRRTEPWWDLAELLDYSPDWQEFIPIQVAGRIPVDRKGMTERVERLIAMTLDRL